MTRRTLKEVLAVLALGGLIALGMAGCGGNVPPVDPCEAARLACVVSCDGECVETSPCAWECRQNPPPPPPPQTCAETTPDGERCCNHPPDMATEACWNKPPGGQWEWIPAAPPPPPPPATCAPPGPVPVDAVEADLVPLGDLSALFHDAILEATQTLGDRRVPKCTPAQNLDAVAAQLKLQLPEHRIIRGIEAVFIERSPDGLWDEYHVVAFGDGGWTAAGRGKFIGTHRLDSPASVCGPPTPPPAYKIKVKRFGGRPNAPKFDAVGLVTGAEYCASVDMGDRVNCPVRLEPVPGGPWQDRVACEALVFGTPVWKSDGTIEPVDSGNPWMRHVIGGTWIQVCTGPSITPEVCSEIKRF